MDFDTCAGGVDAVVRCPTCGTDLEGENPNALWCPLCQVEWHAAEADFAPPSWEIEEADP
jgi:rubrerythrin